MRHKSLNGLSLLHDAQMVPFLSIPTLSLMFFCAYLLASLPKPFELFFDPTSRNSYLSKECLHLCQVLISNLLHGQENICRELLLLQYLYIVEGVALTNLLTLHPNGLSAHLIIIHQVLEVIVCIMLHDVAHHRKDFS